MNSITEEFIKSQIANVEYHQLTGTTITIAVITLKSGFTVTGESACVDPNNFDVIGCIAYIVNARNWLNVLMHLKSFSIAKK